MVIRRARADERDVLLDLWLRSVGATHAFVTAADVEAMTPQVREYLASETTEFWVVVDGQDVVLGFMGMAGNVMESLFLAPEFQRRGIGRRLVEHARERYGPLRVDVNEQNTAARAFYEACGFVVVGRSDTDDQGRPYPLLHLRQVEAS